MNIHSSIADNISAKPRLNTVVTKTDLNPPICLSLPKVDYQLPIDKELSSDDGINCFAWQSFIALNWPADANNRGEPDTSKIAQNFGTPDDLSPTVWQTYKLAQDIFLPGAARPNDWNTPDIVPTKAKPIFRRLKKLKLPRPSYLPVLTMASKVDAQIPGEVVPDDEQATGNILVDQNSHLVRYEKRMNKTEFDYIIDNQLYDGNHQADIVETQGIILPIGNKQQDIPGAIEIKSAWRVLEGEPTSIQNRYKKIKAVLYNPTNKSYSNPTLVGLVGLHIIRKTPSMTGISWSTFEQVDNVSDLNSIPAIPNSKI